MARENIRFNEGNFASDGTYFYTILDGTQALQQKVDDGSVAFSYPLDTSVVGNITELHWDGVYFWSMETQAGGVGITIRKWAIESFICKQKQKIDLTTGATHTYAATAFGVESYHVTVGINNNGVETPPSSGNFGYTIGLTDIVVSDTSMMETGDLLTFVRRNTSTALRSETVFVEKAIVQTVLSPTMVRIGIAMTGDPHGDSKGFRGPDVTPTGSNPPTPDSVFVTKNLWIANANSPGIPGTPALYKVRASSGGNIVQFSGTQYSSIGAMAFYTKYNQGTGLDTDATPYNTTINNDVNAGGKQTYILVARQSSLLFFNVNTNIIDRSLVMNNIKVDTINIWPVFDMVVLGVEPNIVLYRLQQGTTYLNGSLVLTDESWGSLYNYEKQLLRRAVNSIAITASPSIIPANGTAQSKISAVLRDQYNDVVSSKTVNWSEDGGGSSLTPSTVSDDNGVAKNTYTSGLTEQDVKITAAVTDGLV